jgi:hypothetical protein
MAKSSPRPSEQPLDEEVIAALELRLKLLDDAHARARSPAARRKVEAKVAVLKREVEALREEGKVVDIEYARWLRRFNEMLGETS